MSCPECWGSTVKTSARTTMAGRRLRNDTRDIERFLIRPSAGTTELKQLLQSLFQWNSLGPKKAEFVKVAALENDLSVLNLEESASAHPQWVRPFKNPPFSVL